MRQMLFAATLVAALVANAFAQTKIGAEAEVPEVLSLFGIGPKTVVKITNTLPFYGEMIAIDKVVGMIEPGETFFQRYSFEFGYSELPIIIRWYDTPEKRTLIGISACVMGITRGQVNSWTVTFGEVLRLDGSWGGWRESYPTPDVGRTREVEFPRRELLSQTVVQVVNLSYFQLDDIRMNGVSVARVETPGGIYVAIGWSPYNPTPVSLDVVISDRGRFVGHYEGRFTLGSDRTAQFVVTPASNFRRW